MKWMGFIGCLTVALDSANKATGDAPQVVFGHDYLWLWWIAALTWAIFAFRFALHRVTA